jgi:hypothetical protein
MKKILFLSAVMALLAGCSSDELQQTDNTSYIKVDKVCISTKPFLPEEGSATRTTMSKLENGELAPLWTENDVIGVFSVNSNAETQVPQVLGIKESGGSRNATFDGGSWMLRQGNTYAAYYPYCPEMKLGDTYADIPVSMVGQTQSGNNNFQHLGAFAYMYAEPTINETGIVNLNFENAVSILTLDLKFPKDAILNDIELSAETDMFVTKAKMNATNGEIIPVTTSKSITLGLKNVDVTSGQSAIFYISLLPTTNAEKQIINISATDALGTTYVGELRAIKVKQGYAYDRDTEMEVSNDKYDGLDYVDLGTGALWARNNVKLGIKEEGEFITNLNKDEYYEWYGLDAKDEYTWNNYWQYDEENDKCTLCCPDDGRYYMNSDEDDVAYLYIEPSPSWRIPTPEEMQNLIDNCDWIWTQMDGVYGYKVRSKIVPTRWIFLPALGSVSGTEITESNVVGYYWTSELDRESDGWKKAKCLKFFEGSKAISSDFRYIGMSIRPVYIGAEQ